MLLFESISEIEFMIQGRLQGLSEIVKSSRLYILARVDWVTLFTEKEATAYISRAH